MKIRNEFTIGFSLLKKYILYKIIKFKFKKIFYLKKINNLTNMNLNYHPLFYKLYFYYNNFNFYFLSQFLHYFDKPTY